MTTEKAAVATPLKLPEGMTSHYVSTGNGLLVHYLQAVPEPGISPRGTLLLLHGFPELAYSWRRLMPLLARAGYTVFAPDQRGYGRTTGGSTGYDIPLAEYGVLNFVRDQVAFLAALDLPCVDAIIGHDFGSPVTAWASLIRPDLFRAAICMSAPFPGPPGWDIVDDDIHDALRALTPPRRHYQWWYSEPGANADMMAADGGLGPFLRAYFHCKSADWPDNRPHVLAGWDAQSLATMPHYYIMQDGVGMAKTALSMAPPPGDRCTWLTDEDLAVFTSEYGRTGFQGGLNWYRSNTSGVGAAELRLFAGQRIGVPFAFISGAADWGTYQFPGALEAMEAEACADYRGTTLIEGAGHWVQQEQPQKTAEAVLRFLSTL